LPELIFSASSLYRALATRLEPWADHPGRLTEPRSRLRRVPAECLSFQRAVGLPDACWPRTWGAPASCGVLVSGKYANRNETKHLPYGEGTLRVEPLGKALARFARPATVITESPDEESHQAIRAALFDAAGKSSARRSSARSAASSRPSSRKNGA
jgi:hypothetical protein